jgi:(E)-4-hydroxy-3-methylbut-2-enyl-diphosphate synthase
MTNTKTSDIDSTAKQANALAEAGCQIIRFGIPDLESAKAVRWIRQKVKIPVVADIHFDHNLALEVLEGGVDGLRLNPGNIRDQSKVETIVRKAQEKKVPIRIGVNGGSIDRSRYNANSAEGLVASALHHVRILEKLNFTDIKISLKSTDVLTTIEAYKLMLKERDYPLHIGITEAGTSFSGAIKSGIGMGILLYQGIGDTLRVSLSADPMKEVIAARQILRDLHLLHEGVEIISCPTCARSELDVEKIATEIENRTLHIRKSVKIAVMGCVVNGPGEARDADIGVTGNRQEAMLFRGGKVIARIPVSSVVDRLMEEIGKL